MYDLTFLTDSQCIGEGKLDIFKKRGSEAAITDFSDLIGGFCIDSESSSSGQIGEFWAISYGKAPFEPIVFQRHGYTNHNWNDPSVSARPVIDLTEVDSIPTNGGKEKRARDGVLEIEYGYYPQTAVSKDMQKVLEREWRYNELKFTGHIYTIDSKFGRYPEYEYLGKRYIRVNAQKNYHQLSNGEDYEMGDTVWIEVEPIKWLVDEKAKVMVTEKLIFSGVPFSKSFEKTADINDFYDTDIKQFMDEYFSREIEQIMHEKDKGEQTGENIPQRKTRLQRLNPDTTRKEDRKKMTDTEIIQNWIDSGESVLLRGPSGIGKTERIKSLYPDLIYIKLTNNMFPEKVVGSVNLQTGQSIPPDFAKAAILQEATEEERQMVEENIQRLFDIADTVYERSKTSDKKVVIMLDELLNVKPAVQSLVYTLVLNRMVEIGKGLKLPDNVVIVATGNQKKYSSVAEDLAEPLEKRFDHILDMEPKVGEWLTEYAIPQKVHPAVIGFILSKYNSTRRSERIEDIGYFYEEPEVGEEHLDANGCKGRTNDPRGWTSVSESLYNFEENLREGRYEGIDVEDVIQRTIESKLRMEWAEEFYDYYNLPTLTPEEVVEGMEKGYTQADLPRDISERFAYMTALITANEEQVGACREFIRKYCDPEYLEVYDIYWAGRDERRMEKIAELQDEEISLHRGEEAEEYAKYGARAYKGIGQMYSGYLGRETEDRGEGNDR